LSWERSEIQPNKDKEGPGEPDPKKQSNREGTTKRECVREKGKDCRLQKKKWWGVIVRSPPNLFFGKGSSPKLSGYAKKEGSQGQKQKILRGRGLSRCFESVFLGGFLKVGVTVAFFYSLVEAGGELRTFESRRGLCPKTNVPCTKKKKGSGREKKKVKGKKKKSRKGPKPY